MSKSKGIGRGSVRRLPDLTGKTFGRWTVLLEIGRDAHGILKVACACKCGSVRNLDASNITSGKSKSCGCYKAEMISINCAHPTHGHSKNGKPSREYRTWQGIKTRCYNKKLRSYKYYGARGIKVCARWLESFENFFSDMGFKPEGLTIERKNCDGDYEPSNCVWATWSQQNRNKRPKL